MNLIKKVWLPLAAAALTAVAFAAVSVANDDSSSKGGERGDVMTFAGPPPAAVELSDEDRQALEDFRQCMEDNGAELPEPPRLREEGESGEPQTFRHRLDPPSEEERAKMDEAFKACEDKLPEGARAIGPHPCGPPPGAPGEGAAIPAPPPSSGSQQEGTAAPAPAPASS
jgi:hypothetical protein